MPKTELESLHALGAATSIVSKHIGAVEHVLIPPGSELKSMEKLMPQPLRIRSHPAFGDIGSFATYAKEFQDSASRVFVDDDCHRFCIVFDGDKKDVPGWSDHSCSMSLAHSHEWGRFMDHNGSKMSSLGFAEFIEDHLPYLNDEENVVPSGELLTMAQTFKLKLKGDVEVEESLHRGLKTLKIQDDSTIKAGTSGKELTFPETLHFNLRIFKNHDAFPIKVFLRYRILDNSVVFFYKIPDPKLLVEEAFNMVMESVQKETGLPVLRGVYDGPRHKR